MMKDWYVEIYLHIGWLEKKQKQIKMEIETFHLQTIWKRGNPLSVSRVVRQS